ncbi:MAG: hypothetical protein QM756_35805 [Polyangiaceae bacterium]
MSKPFVRDAGAEAELAVHWRVAARALGETRVLDLSCACFGDGESIGVEGRAIYLPSAWARPEQAARAAHLALHRAEPPWSNGEGPCQARVEHAVQLEAAAHVLEVNARRALGVTGARYPFERELAQVPRAERVRWLRDYFWAHPQAEEGRLGIVPSYRQRCN